MSNRDVLSVEVARELKRLVDADERFNREVVEAALWREFGGHRQGALEVRIEEKRHRIKMVESEVETRRDELESLQQEIAALEERHEEKATLEDTVLSDAEGVFRTEQLDPENAAVKKWADDANLSPETFVKRMRQRLGDADD